MKFVDTQTNNILILIFINTNFVTAKDKAIVDAKIMMKSRDARDSNTSLKLNDKIIKRKEKKIYFRQITWFEHLQLIKNVDFIIINSRD